MITGAAITFGGASAIHAQQGMAASPPLAPTAAALALPTTPAVPLPAPPGATRPSDRSQLIQSIVDQVKPALVRIHVVEADAQNGREAKSESFGSGIIISADGYVVTNHHVAGKAKWLSVTLSTKEQVEARLVGTDALADIAVIKLAPQQNGKPYVPALWGDSDSLRVGETVLAMGSPFAFSQSVTAGIVSNTELVMPGSNDFMLDGEDVGSIVRWIGHDAVIYPGNSGGPLVNAHGEIVGINEIELGLSGAIPGNLARNISADLIAHGHIMRAYTGLDLQPRLHNDRRDSGVLVSGVAPNSPAARAGVRAGDLLLQAGLDKIDVKFPEQLPPTNLLLSRLSLGQPTPLVLLRNGVGVNVDITARPRDVVFAQAEEIKSLGLTAMDISAPLAMEMRLPDTSGVMVTTMLMGSPATEAKPPVEIGDVILRVGNKPTDTLASLKAALSPIKRKREGTPTLIEVRRDGDRLLCVSNINPTGSEDASVEVARPYLPANNQVLSPELASMLALPAGTHGVRITQVYPGSAASAAGLKVGDVITKLDGIEVEASQAEDSDIFPSMIRQYKIGSWVKVSLLRRTGDSAKPLWKAHAIGVKLPRAPKEQRELATYHDDSFGLAMRSVTARDILKKNAGRGETGALVTDVLEGSWAALAGLQEGDIIRRIDDAEVNSMEDARNRLLHLEAQRTRSAVFFVTRGVHTLFVELQTDWSLPPTPASAASTTAAAGPAAIAAAASPKP